MTCKALLLMQICAATLAALLPPAVFASDYTILDDLRIVRLTTFGGGLVMSPDGDCAATLECDLLAKGVLGTPRYLPTGASGFHNGEVVHVRFLQENGSDVSITRPGTTSWGLSWSPDGKRLAFYSDLYGRAALCVWDRATRRITADKGVIAEETPGETNRRNGRRTQTGSITWLCHLAIMRA